MNRLKLLKPLIVVNIDAFNPSQQFGVTGVPGAQIGGSLVEKYSNFIINELLPFVKKKAGVRKFSSVSIAGAGLAGISALDIAWDNWQKFDNVGFFSDLQTQNASLDFSLLVKKISQSKKKPEKNFFIDNPVIEEQNKLQENDSSGVKQFVNVLEKKGLTQYITIAGDSNNIMVFKNTFFQFLMTLNKRN